MDRLNPGSGTCANWMRLQRPPLIQTLFLPDLLIRAVNPPLTSGVLGGDGKTTCIHAGGFGTGQTIHVVKAGLRSSAVTRGVAENAPWQPSMEQRGIIGGPEARHRISPSSQERAHWRIQAQIPGHWGVVLTGLPLLHPVVGHCGNSWAVTRPWHSSNINLSIFTRKESIGYMLRYGYQARGPTLSSSRYQCSHWVRNTYFNPGKIIPQCHRGKDIVLTIHSPIYLSSPSQNITRHTPLEPS